MALLVGILVLFKVTGSFEMSEIFAQAQAGEILVSSLLCELTRSSGDIRLGEDRTLELKGIAEPQRVHPVYWE